MAIKLIERGARATARVLRSELVNHRRLDGHPHIIGLKVGPTWATQLGMAWKRAEQDTGSASRGDLPGTGLLTLLHSSTEAFCGTYTGELSFAQEAFLTPTSLAIVLEHADAGDLSRHVAAHCDPLVRPHPRLPATVLSDDNPRVCLGRCSSMSPHSEPGNASIFAVCRRVSRWFPSCNALVGRKHNHTAN